MPDRQSDAAVVYRSDSALRRPGEFFGALARDIRTAGPLSAVLLRRSLLSAYRGSLLGLAWALIPTLALALGLAWLGAGRGFTPVPGSAPPLLTALIGLVLWRTFVEAVNGPIAALAGARTLLLRVKFPREALIVGKAGEVAVGAAVKSLLIVGALAWYGVPPAPTAFLAPVGVLALIVAGTAMGVALAPLGLLYGDVSKALPVLFFVGLFLTPVAFAPPRDGLFAAVVRWNPVTPLLVTTRDWVLGTDGERLPDFLLVSGTGLILLAGAWIAFRLSLPYAAERLGG